MLSLLLFITGNIKEIFSLTDKRKGLKINLDHFNKSSNPLVKDIHSNANQRQNLPKLTPFNQQTLIEKSQ